MTRPLRNDVDHGTVHVNFVNRNSESVHVELFTESNSALTNLEWPKFKHE